MTFEVENLLEDLASNFQIQCFLPVSSEMPYSEYPHVKGLDLYQNKADLAKG